MCDLFILKELILNRFKQLGKDSIIYGLGGILAKSVSFFMLPIYTRIFSRSDYGTIEMLTVISSFVGAILVMGMDSAQSMYFLRTKKKVSQLKYAWFRLYYNGDCSGVHL